MAAHPSFGAVVTLPFDAPEFGFAIPGDGSLPMGGALPSLIDHRGTPTAMSEIPEPGARLLSLRFSHPDPEGIAALWGEIGVDRPPEIVEGDGPKYVARIEIPDGVRTLT